MKMTGKGIFTILVFFIGLPCFIDMIFLMHPGTKESAGLSRFLISSYIRYLPLYILYLAVAFFVLRLVSRYKKIKWKADPDFEFEKKDPPPADNE